jgi:hypothetical protein
MSPLHHEMRVIYRHISLLKSFLMNCSVAPLFVCLSSRFLSRGSLSRGCVGSDQRESLMQSAYSQVPRFR